MRSCMVEQLRWWWGVGADACVWLCCGLAGNGIGEAGAVALSKGVESGNCKLTSLNVSGESGVHGCALRMLLCMGVFVAGRCLGSSGRMLAVVWS